MEAETEKERRAQGSGLKAQGVECRHTSCSRRAFMSRDHRKLEVFRMADALAERVYHATRNAPAEERYGITIQLRRAAVSVACNIVEGCARRTSREYLQFVNVAFGSASEAQYLLHLTVRLGLLSPAEGAPLCDAYLQLLRRLQKLLQAIERM